MPLTEHEQRAFEEIARALADPEHRAARRLLVVGSAGLSGGLALVVATFVVSVWVAALGYLVMLTSTLLLERALRVLVTPRWTVATEPGCRHRRSTPEA